MGYLNSWRFHRDLGRIFGLTLRRFDEDERRERIRALDEWAFEREWQQNLKGETPNDVLGEHQTREAKAWTDGAEQTAGVTVERVALPYKGPA